MSLRRVTKYSLLRAGLEATALPGIRRLWQPAHGRGVIFTLHHVRPAEPSGYAPNAHLSITPEFLGDAIEAALECGLVPVALEDLPQLLSDPTDERRFACFTLDDGSRDNAEYAAPVFRRYGVPYTIFITAGFVERTRSIWWRTVEAVTREAPRIIFDFGRGSERVDLRTIAQKEAAFERFTAFVQTANEDEAVGRIEDLAWASGIDPFAIVSELAMDVRELRSLAADPLVRFGAHTLTHVNLRRVDEMRLRDEVNASAKAVETYIGRQPAAFAYPYGFAAAVGEREMEAVANAGFAIGVTTQPGVISARNLERPTAFNRVSLNGLFQKKRYVTALISSPALALI
jgi:peptidoglycan/xylan/chitin deacetylase (PgdA/CDA1 family)